MEQTVSIITTEIMNINAKRTCMEKTLDGVIVSPRYVTFILNGAKLPGASTYMDQWDSKTSHLASCSYKFFLHFALMIFFL